MPKKLRSTSRLVLRLTCLTNLFMELSNCNLRWVIRKLTVNAFLTWLKSVEEAWGKVSASVTQVIGKLRSNLRTDEKDLRMMLSEKMNERLFTSLSDKVGETLKKNVWPSQKLDGVGYVRTY